MQTNDVPTVKRGRGRPRKVPLQPTGGYSGPSLDSVLQLSDVDVLLAFDGLEGAEPESFRWEDGDDQLNIARHHDYGMTMTELERKVVPPIQELKASAWERHQQGLRMQLMQEYVTRWVAGLSDSQLIQTVESLDNTTLSVSEKRYMKVQDMRERVQQLVWPTIIAASTLYVQPINPLEGGK